MTAIGKVRACLFHTTVLGRPVPENRRLPFLLAIWPLWFPSLWQGQALNIRIMLKERIFPKKMSSGIIRVTQSADRSFWVKGENKNFSPERFQPLSASKFLPKQRLFFCPWWLLYHDLCLTTLSSTVLMVMTPLSPICYWLIHSRLENGVKNGVLQSFSRRCQKAFIF